MYKTLAIVYVLVFLMTAVLTGCGGTKAAATYTDSSKTINLSKNQEFIIALQANPTTGYDWQPDFDAGILNQVKKDYQQADNSGKPLVGSGGTDFFTYKALKAGTTKITLTYKRSWETPKADDKQQVFNVVIK